jgi:HTH-type transcriptional regulator/antitoxin HigA
VVYQAITERGLNMSEVARQAIEHWPYVSPLLCKPQTEVDYDALVLALDELLDVVGEDEAHPLMSLLNIIAEWIEAYDLGRWPRPGSIVQ